MARRAFSHPLAAHPVVGPLLELLDTPRRPAIGPEGYALELRFARHLQLLRFVEWATAVYGLATDTLGLGAVDADLPAELLDVPAALLVRFRPSQAGLTGSREALRLAARVAREGPVTLEPSAPTPLRALAATGVWPSSPPAFVGRLDARVGPAAYAPTLPLVARLADDRRWAEASEVARRLPVKLRISAERVVLEARLRAGLLPEAAAVAPRHEDFVRAALAARATARGEPERAEARWGQIASPVSRHHAAVRLAALALERGEAEPAEAWLGRAAETIGLEAPRASDPRRVVPKSAPGQWLRVTARFAAGNKHFAKAWGCLTEAGRRPRHGALEWSGGARPDAALAADLLALTLKSGHGEPWPWRSARWSAWLDDLDVARGVVEEVGLGPATDPERLLHVRSRRARARLTQAAEVVRISRMAWDLPARGPAEQPEVQAFVRGVFADTAYAEALPRDPNDPIRAAYDDGLARSCVGRQRRRVLVNAAKQTLARCRRAPPAPRASGRAAAEEAPSLRDSSPAAPQPARSALPAADAGLSRIASLAALGGGKAEQVLADHVRAADHHHPLHHAAASALADVAPRALLEPLMTRADHFGAGPEAAGLRAALEAAGALPAGFAQAADALLRRLAEAPVDPLHWWTELCRTIWRTDGAPPNPLILDVLSERADEALARPAGEIFAELTDLAERIDALPPEAWLDRIVCSPVGLRLSLARARPPTAGAPWPVGRWESVLREARHPKTGTPALSVLEDHVRSAAGRGADLAERLLAGRPPSPALEAPIPVEDTRLRLRGLHKVKDAFDFLRFADAVPCCFNSRSPWYVSVDAPRHIRKLWRDPMSFCLLVESSHPPHRGRGFVFGAFGERSDGAQAVLLNGLYLSRNDEASRQAILRTLERALARPVGAKVIGIANRYGGKGYLPPRYRARREIGRRRRALVGADGRLERWTYDDISRRVNAFVPLDLSWCPVA